MIITMLFISCMSITQDVRIRGLLFSCVMTLNYWLTHLLNKDNLFKECKSRALDVADVWRLPNRESTDFAQLWTGSYSKAEKHFPKILFSTFQKITLSRLRSCSSSNSRSKMTKNPPDFEAGDLESLVLGQCLERIRRYKIISRHLIFVLKRKPRQMLRRNYL